MPVREVFDESPAPPWPPPAIAGHYTLTASAAACAPIHPAGFTPEGTQPGSCRTTEQLKSS
jgi:hypothetical protein